MTDWTPPNAGSPAPPPPPPGGWAPPPPQGPPPQGPWGTPGWAGPPGAGGYAVAPPPKRPKAVVGGVLLLVAAGLLALGTFLPWVSARGVSANGFDNYFCSSGECIVTTADVEVRGDDSVSLENPGAFTLIGAAILAAFGITLLAAGRILAIAILGLVCSGIGLLISLGIYAVANEVADSAFVDADLGSGPIFVVLSAVVGVAGSIVALAQRGPRPTPGYAPGPYG